MSAVTVAVLVFVIKRYCFTPRSSTFKIDVLDIGSSVNDVDIDTFSAFSSVKIFVEGTEAQALSMRYSSEAPRGTLLEFPVFGSMDNRVSFNVIDLTWYIRQ